jgi:hypothetical protein
MDEVWEGEGARESNLTYKKHVGLADNPTVRVVKSKQLE